MSYSKAAGLQELKKLYLEIMENKMEATTLYRDYIGRMENKMETTDLWFGDLGLRLSGPSKGRAGWMQKND